MLEESTYLYVDEVERITGYVRSDAQKKWLTENGWKFVISSSGKPVILRKFANSAENLAVKQKINEKNLSVSRMVNINELDVLTDAIASPKCAGIYFLIKESKIVYIGQSINLLSRLGSHTKRIDFDKYTFVKCAKEHLNDVESALISRFNPEHNIHHRRYSLEELGL